MARIDVNHCLLPTRSGLLLVSASSPQYTRPDYPPSADLSTRPFIPTFPRPLPPLTTSLPVPYTPFPPHHHNPS
jgi:hypothetical protein